ncbi:hypothetical protein LTR94_029089, partial [Friedmanniomyces endolithicus]
EAERLAMGEYRAPRGHLTITAPLMFGRLHVEPVVREFLQAYPEIDVRLVLADYVVNLIDDRVDAAVRIGALPDSTMVATRLGAHVDSVLLLQIVISILLFPLAARLVAWIDLKRAP